MSSSASATIARALRKKPMAVVALEAAAAKAKLVPSLNVWDLMAIGIGGTVGSGVFVICGLIISSEAGTASIFSWIVAGLSCTLSGLAYCELSGSIPSSGGAYAYTYVTLGELPAVLVAWCLTLEYGLSSAAVARSWGDKVELWLEDSGHNSGAWGPVHPIPGCLMAVAVMITACGIETSKRTVNAVCVLKLLLIAFMIATSYWLWDAANIQPWAPFGIAGVAKASTVTFFGYLGWDEVCLMSLEAKNPQRDVPLSLVSTIFVVTLIYVMASLALSGVLPYNDIDAESAFSEAFQARGVEWAHQVAAIGEIATLPLVVLVSFIAQPRLQFSLAEDGLLPPVFGEVRQGGAIMKGSVIAGALCVLVASVVPFAQLGDMISAGVLLSFNATNASLIVLRRRDLPSDIAEGLEGEDGPMMSASSRICQCAWRYTRLHRGGIRPSLRVILMNVCAMICASLWSLSSIMPSIPFIRVLSFAAGAAFIMVTLSLSLFCPPSPPMDVKSLFRVPLVPLIPAVATLINWLILVQLSWSGAVALVVYLGAGLLHYACYGFHHSMGGRNGWASSSSLLPGADQAIYTALLQMGAAEHGRVHGDAGEEQLADAAQDELDVTPVAISSPVPLHHRKNYDSGTGDDDLFE
jgi:amino acid transporter